MRRFWRACARVNASNTSRRCVGVRTVRDGADNVLIWIGSTTDIYDQVRMAMEKAGLGHVLRGAEDGQKAIDYFQDVGDYGDRGRCPLPSVVLLDLKLPQVMDMEVLQWIRERHARTIVVIILTSSSQEADMQKAYELGANAYVVKPGNPRQLDELLNVISRFWLGVNQPTAATPEPPCAKKKESGPSQAR